MSSAVALVNIAVEAATGRGGSRGWPRRWRHALVASDSSFVRSFSARPLLSQALPCRCSGLPVTGSVPAPRTRTETVRSLGRTLPGAARDLQGHVGGTASDGHCRAGCGHRLRPEINTDAGRRPSRQSSPKDPFPLRGGAFGLFNQTCSGRIRTCNLLIRSQVLYPFEPRGRPKQVCASLQFTVQPGADPAAPR